MSKTNTPDEEVLIIVNGEEIPHALVEQELQLLFERYGAEMSQEEIQKNLEKIVSDAQENAVERVLLTQQARLEIKDVRSEEVDARFTALKEQHGGESVFDEQFDLSPEDITTIKTEIADGLRMEQYFDLLCENITRPTESDSRAYYEAHLSEFKVPETVQAAHIVQQPGPELPVEKVNADLLNVRERLVAGESFEELAREFSQCDEDSSDLGYFARGQMVPAFEEVAFNTEVGGYSDVFQSEFGYHVLKVLDRKPESMQAFEEVRYDIENWMFDERKNEVIGLVADDLRKAATIENLEPFEEK